MTEELDHRIAALAGNQHGVFAKHHLDALGVDPQERRHRVERGRWVALHEGVYLIGGAPRTWHTEVLAGVWAGGNRACASHRTAAALWKVPGGTRAPIELTCPRWRRARHDGLLVHESTRLDAIDVSVRLAIPCTTIERTLFDLAGVVGSRTIELAIDDALRRDLTTLTALMATRDRLAKRGRRGAAGFRRALEARDPLAALPESAPERLLARMIERAGLPTPEAQVVVTDSAGTFVARVDLGYPDLKIAIEFDSVQEHTGKEALIRDSARRNRLIALGWTVLTATAADLRDGAAFVGILRRTLELAS